MFSFLFSLFLFSQGYSGSSVDFHLDMQVEAFLYLMNLEVLGIQFGPGAGFFFVDFSSGTLL